METAYYIIGVCTGALVVLGLWFLVISLDEAVDRAERKHEIAEKKRAQTTLNKIKVER